LPGKSLQPLLFDLRFQLREDGLRTMLGRILQRLRGPFQTDEEELIVILQDLDRLPAPRPVEDELDLEPLGEEHLPGLYELNRQRGFMRANPRFARYVEYGYNGYVALSKGKVVGYYWWVDGSSSPAYPDLANLSLDIELGDGDMYGSDFFILESHRGGGRGNALLHRIEVDLRERGYRWLWGYVVSDNRPARWLYSSRGYKPMWSVLRRTGPFRKVETVRNQLQEASA
jgi:GNAT superfamily N-acetyltransferase